MGTDTVSPGTDTTTVTVVCTGKVRDAVGGARLSYTFTGRTLREFLETFFNDYPVRDLVMATKAADERAPGWAPTPDVLPGKWATNPPGDRTRRFARVTINGTFNEHLEGLDTRLSDGDRIGLLYPFMYCV